MLYIKFVQILFMLQIEKKIIVLNSVITYRNFLTQEKKKKKKKKTEEFPTECIKSYSMLKRLKL